LDSHISNGLRLSKPKWKEFIDRWAVEMTIQLNEKQVHQHAFAFLKSCDVLVDIHTVTSYVTTHVIDGETVELYVVKYGDVLVFGSQDEFAYTTGHNPPSVSVVY
jgi:hypothetical protein